MWAKAYAETCSVAVRQLGLVTAGQLRRLGLLENALVDTGLLTKLDWDVYQVAGSSTEQVYAFPYAAWLALSPEEFAWERLGSAVVSHGSAARLHAIGAVRAPVVAFTARIAYPAPRATKVFVREVSTDDRTLVGGVPVTSVARTLHDLVAGGYDHDELRHAITEAVERDLIDLRELYHRVKDQAAEQDIPTDGPSFVGLLVGEVEVAALSVRNQRALAELVLPNEVAALTDALRKTFQQVPTYAGADVLRDLAAEAIARTTGL